MSTRSGKRIHKSDQEAPIEDTNSLQSERKTRSKMQKENVEVSINRKNNYVSYPTEVDSDVTSSEPVHIHKNSSRRTRRNTLKEQNVDVLVTSIDYVSDKSKVKKSHKNKKSVDVENNDIKSIENIKHLESKLGTDDKKKSKKKKNHKKTIDEQAGEPLNVVKKKGGKKKKKSNSFILQEWDQNNIDMANRKNTSMDSFHCTINNTLINKNTKDSDQNILESHDQNVLECNGVTTNFDVSDARAAGSLSSDKYTEKDSKGNFLCKFKDTDKFNYTTSNKKRLSINEDSTCKKNGNIFENKETQCINTTCEEDPQNTISNKELPRVRRSSQIIKILSDGKPLNSTVESNSKSRNSKVKSLDTTFEKDEFVDLNATFDVEKADDKNSEVESKQSSLISSDATLNITYDKCNENSYTSDISDKSKTENILNFTPVLVESSIDETQITEYQEKTPETFQTQTPSTSFKREGTFTKDDADIITSKISTEKTPLKQKSLPPLECIPFPLLRNSQNNQMQKSVLNVTRSIEKSLRRSSQVDIVPKQTKVIFCSPENNPAVFMQNKGKVIKSNLKGSNKSFVFDSSVSSEVHPGRRKRSLTQSEADTRAKRKRLADDLQHSVDRLSRPRTLSAAAKLAEVGSPSRKPVTPSKAKPDGAVPRTKLPNFAALHQKQFAKMESLDECQRRKARRARQLLTPTGGVGLLQRMSPDGTSTNPVQSTENPQEATKMHTPFKTKLPTISSLNPGYTRFGFKLNTVNNPFSMTSTKSEVTEKEKRSNGVLRQRTCLALPSLAGATASRRSAARLPTGPVPRRAVTREKSFSEKRDVDRKENRTIIKGVRTNRRFELQMKSRNINA